MNTSLLLPSEIMHMATPSGECSKQDSQASRGTYPLDFHHSVWPPLDDSLACDILDDAFPLPDIPSYDDQRLYLDASSLLDGTPDLSDTPISCASNDSLATAGPLHPIPELSLSSYVPVMDTFGSSDALVERVVGTPGLDLFRDCNSQLTLSDSTSLWMNPFEDKCKTIHSPKPVFAYQTLQFDLDRIQSPQLNKNHEGTVAHWRKRCRDDDEVDDIFANYGKFKRSRTSLDTPQTVPLFPEPPYPTSLRRQSFADDIFATEDLPTMDMLFDNMYNWDDAAWAGLSCY